MRIKAGLFSAIAAGALVICASTPAKAIIMTVGSANASTTSNTGGGGSGDRNSAHAVSVTNTGGSAPDTIGAMITAASRYTSNAAADRGASFSGGTATAQVNSDYTLTVTVDSTFSGQQWQVDVDTRLTGGLTVIDDAAGAASDNANAATVSNVTGRLNGVVNAGLGLTSNTVRGGTSSTSGVQTSVNSTSGIFSVFGTGDGVFTLRFTWTSVARSNQAIAGGDEAGARFGLVNNGLIGGAGAHQYPGVGNRDSNNDGHFVNMKLTVNVVPEPSTLAMAGIGAMGLGLAAYRRRRVR